MFVGPLILFEVLQRVHIHIVAVGQNSFETFVVDASCILLFFVDLNDYTSLFILIGLVVLDILPHISAAQVEQKIPMTEQFKAVHKAKKTQ